MEGTARIGSGRGGSDGGGWRHWIPFGKMIRFRAGHALARRAARARSLRTMEGLEWLMMDDVERFLARFRSGNLSSSSSFAVFTCAVPSIRMTSTRRNLKRGTMEHQHASPPSPSISSSSMAGHTTMALRSLFLYVFSHRVERETEAANRGRERFQGGHRTKPSIDWH